MSINNEMCFERFYTVVNVEIPSPGEANSWKSVLGSEKSYVNSFGTLVLPILISSAKDEPWLDNPQLTPQKH